MKLDMARVSADRRNWVDALGAETRAALLAVGRPRRFLAGATVYYSTDTPDGVFLIVSGSAYLQLGRRTGETLLLRIARQGEVLGELVALDAAPAPIVVSARTDLAVISFPRPEFARLRTTYPEIRDALVQALSVHLRGSLQLMEEIALLALPERARSRLCILAQEASPLAAGVQPVALDITQAELASMLACSRPALNKVLAALEDAGEIALRFKVIEVRPGLMDVLRRKTGAIP